MSSVVLLILLGALEWAFLVILVCTFGLSLAAIAQVYMKLGKGDEGDDVPSEDEDTTAVV